MSSPPIIPNIVCKSAMHFGGRNDISCTSFFPTKSLGSFGDGGAIFTNDKNEIKLQYKYDGNCFEEIYQKLSYLNVDNYGIPEDFKLHKNFPNPFNPITNIIFDLPVADYISLRVYSIRGRYVGEITNGFFLPGQYQFQFNGKDLSSGIYFITLKSSSMNISQKIVLLK